MASIRGYFDCNTETLATLDQAVRRVAEGGAFYSATLYSFDARDRRVPIQRVLNPSQLRVFAMIGDGSDDSTAATHLGLSPSTVNSHRKDIMARLGVHSRAELMKLAWATGMVRLAEYGDVLRPGFEAFPPERAARWTHPWPPAKGDHAVHSDADRGAA